MNLTDEQREQAIADQARKIEEAFARGDMEQARVCKETMRVLIAERSRKQVERMESKIFNDGTGAPGQRDPVHAGAPSPNNLAGKKDWK